MSEETRVRVAVRVGGCTGFVSTRTANIVHWLVVNNKRMSEVDKVAVEFHCAGKNVAVTVNDHAAVQRRFEEA